MKNAKDAFDYWMQNTTVTALQVAEMFGIHPKHIWREYAKHKASETKYAPCV